MHVICDTTAAIAEGCRDGMRSGTRVLLKYAEILVGYCIVKVEYLYHKYV